MDCAITSWIPSVNILRSRRFSTTAACDDAKALAQIYVKMIEDLALRGVTALENVNTGLGGTRELAKKIFTSSFCTQAAV